MKEGAKLQWGPPSIGKEIGECRVDLSYPTTASMGPSQYREGNSPQRNILGQLAQGFNGALPV